VLLFRLASGTDRQGAGVPQAVADFQWLENIRARGLRLIEYRLSTLDKPARRRRSIVAPKGNSVRLFALARPRWQFDLAPLSSGRDAR
jgi:hypothetical protein